mmetsp:Transcript_45655/g.138422  ORF Transcript_45655/g.138422 Transcript_45655/m.138422 type:complete len:219 (-) Transcript_45655:562-1218(-)
MQDGRLLQQGKRCKGRGRTQRAMEQGLERQRPLCGFHGRSSKEVRRCVEGLHDELPKGSQRLFCHAPLLRGAIRVEPSELAGQEPHLYLGKNRSPMCVFQEPAGPQERRGRISDGANFQLLQPRSSVLNLTGKIQHERGASRPFFRQLLQKYCQERVADEGGGERVSVPRAVCLPLDEWRLTGLAGKKLLGAGDDAGRNLSKLEDLIFRRRAVDKRGV